jgi:PTH1 family peptidyl-tRNA hydrolase
MILIVGLGNPGKKYEETRHNLGFMVIDELVRKWRVSPHVQKKLFSLTFHQPDQQVVLARPQLYMNQAGLAVSRLVNMMT